VRRCCSSRWRKRRGMAFLPLGWERIEMKGWGWVGLEEEHMLVKGGKRGWGG